MQRFDELERNIPEREIQTPVALQQTLLITRQGRGIALQPGHQLQRGNFQSNRQIGQSIVFRVRIAPDSICEMADAVIPAI